MRHGFAIAAVVALSASSLFAQNNIFVLGTAKAARGQTATGTLEVPAGSDAALSLPVAVGKAP